MRADLACNAGLFGRSNATAAILDFKAEEDWVD